VDLPRPIPEFARRVADAGGRLYVVGGSVRDHCLGLPANDHDLEVHLLPADQVRRILRAFGGVAEVGRSFGVFKLRAGGAELDVALPRADDHQSGAAPRVAGDPFLGVHEASRRRDLTINALLYDVLDREILDLHGGLDDLRAGRLREVAQDTFLQDPLRPLRAIRFAACLEFTLADSLRDLCRGAAFEGVPAERVRGELEKALLRAPRPGVVTRLARELELTAALFPKVTGFGQALDDALDRAAPHRDALEAPHEAYALMAAALLHRARPKAALAWMEWLRINRVGRRPVRQVVRSLLAALPDVTPAPPDAAMRRLADQAPLRLLLRLADAVHPGRAALIERAEWLGVADAPLPRLVSGEDLMKAGVAAGPAIGRALKAVREAQYTGAVVDRSQAMALVEGL